MLNAIIDRPAAPPPATRDIPPHSSVDDGVRLTTGQLAQRLGIAKATIRNWRLSGRGPVYIKAPGKFGAVAYRRCDVIDWENRQTRHSTSDTGVTENANCDTGAEE